MKPLLPRTHIQQYLIEKVVDVYDDKITYIAEDFNLDRKVLLCERDISDVEITKKLLSFEHLNMQRTDSIIEVNDKVYSVSKIPSGIKFEKYLYESNKVFTEKEVNIIANSFLEMMMSLRSKKLALNLRINNLLLKNKKIILSDSSNIIVYTNDTQMIYDLGCFIYLIMTKSLYKEGEKLKKSSIYSVSICELVNRMLSHNESEKYKNISDLFILFKGNIVPVEEVYEPIVYDDKINKASSIASLSAIILVVAVGLYVLLSDRKIVKIEEMDMMDSAQFHIAAYMDEPEAQYALGQMYEKGYSVDVDIKKSIEWYKKSAYNSNLFAQLYLGHIYKNGIGVVKDIKKALYWYKLAADLNSEVAQYNIGYIYYKGLDIPIDNTKAIIWLEKAANQEVKSAYYILGILYLNIDGKAIDYKKSFKWFSKGLDDNNSYSQMAVGYMYENGYGVTKDEYKAAHWYEKAAVAGHVEAQFNLANIYQYGKGVAVDKKKAKKWYRESAAQGNKRAIDTLNKLNKKSKQKQIKTKNTQDEVYEKSRDISYGRFIDKGEFIEDTETGLYWQKNGRQSGRLNFYQAKEYAKNLTLGGVKNWRVPTVKELERIYPAVEKPFVNTSYQDMEYNRGKNRWPAYWTSELDTRMKDYAYLYQWYGDGGKNNCYASKNYYYVRCVHD